MSARVLLACCDVMLVFVLVRRTAMERFNSLEFVRWILHVADEYRIFFFTMIEANIRIEVH